MYAIIESGGKQFKVEEGSVINVEKLNDEPGAKVEFPVLMLVDGDKTEIGQPTLKVKVEGEVTGQRKAKKLTILKYKAKKDNCKKRGHRQPYTVVKITKIG